MCRKVALVLLSGFLYSLAIAGVQVASRSITPTWLTTFRLIAASAVFGVVLAFARPAFRWQARSVLDILIIGVLNIGFSSMLLAISMRYISSSLASVLYNIMPAMTVVLAHFFLPAERLRPVKAVGTLVAVAGAVILVSSNASGLATAHSQGWIGQALIILASLAGAVGVIYTRMRIRNMDTTVLAAGQVFACLLVFVPLALVTEGIPPLLTYPWQAWAATVVAGLGSPVFGFWLLFYIVKKYSASLGGFSGIATPLFSTLLGILFLGEIITTPIAVGTILLLAGIGFLNYF